MLFIQVYRMSRRALTALCASLLFLANGGAGAAQQRLGRITTPEEVASVIVFCASGVSPQTTGNTIDICGGAEVR